MTAVVAVVLNPGSGRAHEELQAQVVDSLGGLGEVHRIEPSSNEAFAEDVRAGTEGADIVVAAGGDGTLNLTINALESHLSEFVFAVVPLGTGNDFARTLGLPSDPLAAAASLTASAVREVDVGVASGARVRRLFINACLGGFPVDANKAIDGGLKQKLGPLAFAVGGAKALGDLDESTVVVNDQRISECIALGVGNGRTAGGGMEMWPSASPDDGVLDVCALSAGSIPAALLLAGKVTSGNHESAPGVEMIRGREFVVEADPPMEFNVDGELVGLHTPARFEIFGRTRFLSAE